MRFLSKLRRRRIRRRIGIERLTEPVHLALSPPPVAVSESFLARVVFDPILPRPECPLLLKHGA
jgi:hypothetical protein